MTTPSPPRNPDVDATPGMVAAFVFIAVIVLDIVSLEWDARDWQAIVKALVKDPGLWRRLIADEERLQQKQAMSIGQELPRQTTERMCSHDSGA